uniref:RPAP1/MINIYO-like TPR repeats domain-containing protein n=1 Tax=Ciona intestinalis TaxID=7719 RepID=F7BP59_CIOIN
MIYSLTIMFRSCFTSCWFYFWTANQNLNSILTNQFQELLHFMILGDCDVELKLALWSQHTEVVSSIHVDIDELPVAEDLYFSPIETNPQVLMSYLQALVHGKCQPVRTPFMYRLAIHHLSSYLAMEEETKARHEILKKVSLLPTSKMKHAILHNVDSETKTI